MAVILQRSVTRLSVEARAAMASVERAAQVEAAIPALPMGQERVVKATQVSTADLSVAVVVVTLKQAAPTGLVKAATVRSTGGSQQPLSVMAAVAVQATTTLVSKRLAALTAVALAATTPTTPKREFRTRVAVQAAGM
tara:strand:+ start:475 stop:888 length:414 start_codon:yes stop_codon:yes gene_type:complete